MTAVRHVGGLYRLRESVLTTAKHVGGLWKFREHFFLQTESVLEACRSSESSFDHHKAYRSLVEVRGVGLDLTTSKCSIF